MMLEIRCCDPLLFDKARELSLIFGIPFNETKIVDKNNKNSVCLNYIELKQDQILLIQFDRETNKELCLEIDFSSPSYNRKFTSVKKEILGRALGWKHGYRKVLDLTAGLGVDSVFISQMGFEVTAVERNPALALLLSQALLKSPNIPIQFIYSQADKYLRELTEVDRPEVIYYDPMYPSTKKTALPGKNMQVLRQMIGEDEADSELLRLAISKCIHRVVVKRPVGAPCIIEKPTIQLEGKLVRYDIYVPDRVQNKLNQ